MNDLTITDAAFSDTPPHSDNCDCGEHDWGIDAIRAQNDARKAARKTMPELPVDVAPQSTHEYACEVCGVELHYGGRGRKPTRCDEHKRNASKTSGSSSRIKGTNEQLAAQATEVLVQSNVFASFAVMMLGLKVTATAIKDAQSEFRTNAYNALLLDPKLCRRILSVGGHTAMVALILAYGALIGNVAPVAVEELRTRRAEAEANMPDEYAA